MLVSIIIPCYNVENYIEECLSSVLRQSYNKLEIICIDNNSQDSTWSLLQNFKKRYPHLVVEKGLNPGAPAARNKGLSIAKGKWIQFLDADDLLLPIKIQHQVSLIEPKAAFIAGSYLKQKVNGKKVENKCLEYDPFKALFTTELGITSSNLWNRKWLEKINGWKEELKSSQEADLMFRMIQLNENIIRDLKPYTIIRERPSGQISQRDPRDKWLQYFNSRIEFWEWLQRERPNYSSQNFRFFQKKLFGIIRQIAKFDVKLAKELKVKYIHFSFQPLNSKGEKGFYFYSYKIIGFELSEKLYHFKSNIK